MLNMNYGHMQVGVGSFERTIETKEVFFMTFTKLKLSAVAAGFLVGILSTTGTAQKFSKPLYNSK